MEANEAVGVVNPLPNEVLDQRPLDSGNWTVLQRLKEQRGIVVHSSDGNLRIKIAVKKGKTLKLFHFLFPPLLPPDSDISVKVLYAFSPML